MVLNFHMLSDVCRKVYAQIHNRFTQAHPLPTEDNLCMQSVFSNIVNVSLQVLASHIIGILVCSN